MIPSPSLNVLTLDQNVIILYEYYSYSKIWLITDTV